MLANHTLYEIIEEVKAIINEECSVWNLQGKCVASTSQELAETLIAVKTFLEKEDADLYITKKNACFGIRYDGELVYAFAIHNVMDNVEVLGKLCVVEMASEFAAVALLATIADIGWLLKL